MPQRTINPWNQERLFLSGGTALLRSTKKQMEIPELLDGQIRFRPVSSVLRF